MGIGLNVVKQSKQRFKEVYHKETQGAEFFVGWQPGHGSQGDPIRAGGTLAAVDEQGWG